MDRKPVFDEVRRLLKRPITTEEVQRLDAAFDQGLGLNVLPFTPSAVDPKLVAALKGDEGCRLVAYLDTEGVWTIGYGHTKGVHRGMTISQEQAEALLYGDIEKHNAATHAALPWLKNLDPVRRRVIENMGFNLGVDRLLTFKNTLAYVQSGQYRQAADNMLQSKWASQVKGRAVRLAKEMRTGVE